ncbi:MAG: YbaK/EbsC family protein [bacterium]|nr:YbaK/EbsC family protein [bacterium]
MSVFEQIRETLDRAGVTYDLREHPPVYTSQEAAAARGCDLKQGAKALVLHVDKERYILAVISAVKQADFEKLRAHLGARKVRLSTPEEAFAQTGCTIGSVPPFGNLLNLPTYVDPSLGENKIIAFNPGSHAHSILMRYEDYISLVQPEVVAFAKEVS